MSSRVTDIERIEALEAKVEFLDGCMSNIFGLEGYLRARVHALEKGHTLSDDEVKDYRAMEVKPWIGDLGWDVEFQGKSYVVQKLDSRGGTQLAVRRYGGTPYYLCDGYTHSPETAVLWCMHRLNKKENK